MCKDFRAFIMRGNILDLAIGLIIGSAFSKIISSLVSDIIMPPIGLILSGIDFSELGITLQEASASHEAVQLKIGVFITTIVNFLVISAVIFLLIRQLTRWQKAEPAVASIKDCPQCCNQIPIKAKRCGFCGSEIE